MVNFSFVELKPDIFLFCLSFAAICICPITFLLSNGRILANLGNSYSIGENGINDVESENIENECLDKKKFLPLIYN